MGHCPRAAAAAFAPGAGGEAKGLSCTGGGAVAAGPTDGCGGSGSGQIGSTAACWPDAAALNGRLCGRIGGRFVLCERRDEAGAADCGFGLAAAVAATPGRTGPVGSEFMMLIAGIEAAVGKSMLTILRAPGEFAGAAGAAAWTCGRSPAGGSDALAQIGR